MRMLNRSKAFGSVHPPEMMEGCDRPAMYTQDGLWFDAYDREIVPGESLGLPPQEGQAETSDDRRYSPGELVQAANEIPWALFQREAKRILGEACPAGKDAIINALKKAIGDYQQRKARSSARIPRAQPEVPDQDPPDTETVVEAAPPPKAKTKAAGEVDLAAWARGDRDYLFGDIRKAIRKTYSKQIAGPNEKMEALDFLVSKKVIPAAAARKDVTNVDVM